MENTISKEFRQSLRQLTNDIKAKEKELKEVNQIPAKIRLDQLFIKKGEYQ